MLVGKHLMISGMIAMMVSSTAVMAQINPLSEADLEGVSAQGLQNVANLGSAEAQNNNNDAVDLSGNTQEAANTVEIVNSAGTALNTNQNIANFSAGKGEVVQKNAQDAKNYKVSKQDVENKGVVKGQNNNNGAVKASGTSQAGASAIVLSNSANSAENEGQNIVNVENAKGVLVTQTNAQNANNVDAKIQRVVSHSDVIAQNNNNGAIQMSEDAQSAASGMSISNSAASAKNVGQNIMYANAVTNTKLTQLNVQNAEHTKKIHQHVENDASSLHQNNNSGSIQMNDNAQNGANGLAITNAAYSAENIGQNILNATDLVNDHVIAQTNRQNALNAMGGGDPEKQTVITKKKAENNNNNNAAVQVNNAQNAIQGLSLTNSANSAVNVGQNIARIANPAGNSFIKQTNEQNAKNEYATLQEVHNGYALNQNNNNGAVQLIDAQNEVTSFVVLNSANSAVNSGINIADIDGLAADAQYGSMLEQCNLQNADNEGTSVQEVSNCCDVVNQNSNNGSVQLINSQAAASSLIIGNIAGGAVNYGLNLANVQNAAQWTVNQVANQHAYNH